METLHGLQSSGTTPELPLSIFFSCHHHQKVKKRLKINFVDFIKLSILIINTIVLLGDKLTIFIINNIFVISGEFSTNQFQSLPSLSACCGGA